MSLPVIERHMTAKKSTVVHQQNFLENGDYIFFLVTLHANMDKASGLTTEPICEPALFQEF